MDGMLMTTVSLEEEVGSRDSVAEQGGGRGGRGRKKIGNEGTGMMEIVVGGWRRRRMRDALAMMIGAATAKVQCRCARQTKQVVVADGRHRPATLAVPWNSGVVSYEYSGLPLTAS